ncbi:hypothetical protein GQ600_3893 [Phytophthora cactorum]|nr:hypothetical protein GQ600_3893 [Phytophthora cactorum]
MRWPHSTTRIPLRGRGRSVFVDAPGVIVVTERCAGLRTSWHEAKAEVIDARPDAQTCFAVTIMNFNHIFVSLTRGNETFMAGLLVSGERSSCMDNGESSESVRGVLVGSSIWCGEFEPHLMLAASVRHRNVCLVEVETPVGGNAPLYAECWGRVGGDGREH